MAQKYNYTMKTGRPSSYEDRFVDSVDEYLTTTGREQTELPTKQGFAIYIGVDDDTLDNWAEAKDVDGKLIRPEFFAALKKLMQYQFVQLANDGVYGGKDINASIIKLILMSNHGMKERNDTTTNGKELPAMVRIDTKPPDTV